MSKVDTAVVAQNGNVLANAAALIYAIVSQLGDGNVSRSINGESLTRDHIEHMAAMRLTSSIETNA